ncbi:Asp-tRNA(Asn)/Glu-tRNA(Gln) amidotransferase subunit GatC [Lentibacillus sp.]|uniref:Asp-tRNA(Asn)/Glu-tRNA(Gln) amidotransferase subunit GatC n=1 Tax=Lentibacillus sp. TaxID=1925746 RepID=UPI002B4AD8EC|nr:Asp-tRNA(Asn)/Glu-tRNA(Gln) amidotransferase subunit GatC [Lentibacillus sp.]HLS07462.1 Asp-tRNA(Asn)/Glu-tRNA(Gln) amidotransferase subunit GatC [Lentibacillus sp.]
MADISKDDVKHVANLARLAITEEEADMFTDQLSSIIEYAEQLNELDTENVEPTTHVLDLKNVLRKDEPKEWISKEEALKNAPDKQDGYFRVPSILE